jgi:hypothetical protein
VYIEAPIEEDYATLLTQYRQKLFTEYVSDHYHPLACWKCSRAL